MHKPSSPFLAAIYEQMLVLRYAMSTIEAYLYWIRFYIRYHGLVHPANLGEDHVSQFLTFLADERHVSAKTQAQALNALVFLYKRVLNRPFTLQLAFRPSHRTPKLPSVLTPQEVGALLTALPVHLQLPAKLLYGSGLRLMEAMRLRVQDVDAQYLSLMIWNGKGAKHRRVTLASELLPALQQQVAQVRHYYQADMQCPEYAGVWLPDALARKYPAAPRELGWHYLFAASHLSRDPYSGKLRRHHLDASVLQKAIRQAGANCSLAKPSAATPCDTVSPPTCSPGAPISAPCRSSWGTRMCAPPRSTLMCCNKVPTVYAVRFPTCSVTTRAADQAGYRPELAAAPADPVPVLSYLWLDSTGLGVI